MTMKLVAILTAFLCVSARDPIPHAGCIVQWTVQESCDSVQQKISDQMIILGTDDCGNPPTMKCMYNLKGSYGPITTGTHTTWDFGYIDDLDFVFTDMGDGRCAVNGRSRSQVESIYDYSVNYCNIYNLMEGAGLTSPDISFTEVTQDEICTVYSQRNCTWY